MKNILSKITILLSLIVLVGCTNPDKATEILTAQGYTNIEFTGYKPFAGSDNDTYKTGFRAKNSNGVIVTGTVTGGYLRGYTVRLD